MPTWTEPDYLFPIVFDGAPKGTSMRVRFARFFVFAEGRIVEVRNYDCFDPW